MSVLGIVTAFRRAKDLILIAGPDGIRTFADGIHAFEEGCRRAADYLERIAPLVSFAPGDIPAGPKDVPALSPQLRGEVQAAKNLKAEIEAAMKAPMPAAAPMPKPDGPQEGLVDWIKSIDPETKKAILNIILGLLAKVIAANPGA